MTVKSQVGQWRRPLQRVDQMINFSFFNDCRLILFETTPILQSYLQFPTKFCQVKHRMKSEKDEREFYRYNEGTKVLQPIWIF